MKTKALIINFNRLTLPRNMAEWLSERGCNPIIIDNNSDYPPLLKWYDNCPFEVIRMGGNFGHTVVWNTGLIGQLNLEVKRYIITDPDLDLSSVPDDFLRILNQGLDKYPTYDKCGLSLETNDLPKDVEGFFIRNRCEGKYWKKPLDEMYFHADTDTTLALYREGASEYNHNAIRTNRPYTAKHLPWYYRNFTNLPEDEQYYFKTASTDFSSGKKRLMQ